jgi:hypothetical protein
MMRICAAVKHKAKCCSRAKTDNTDRNSFSDNSSSELDGKMERQIAKGFLNGIPAGR